MIAKFYVGNPDFTQNIKGEGNLTFSTQKEQMWAVRQVVKELEFNKKELVLLLDYASKKRTLDQNSLLWGLLNEEAKALSGGRKDKDITAEKLYYQALNDYGKDSVLCIKNGCEKELKKVYKKVYIIDKYTQNGEEWLKCRCVIGSSNYTTKEMSDLIEGVLDDITQAEIDTQEIRFLRRELEEYGNHKG